MKQRYDSYKPSGIDWIGEIPSHWSALSLKQVSSSIRNGYVGPTKDILVDNGVPYIQSLHVKDGKICFERGEYYVTSLWGSKHPKIYTNDIVIVQTGDIGQVAIIPEEYNGCNCHALIILVPDFKISFPSFLSYYLRSDVGKELMLLTKTGATLPHLNSGSICNTQVVLPPLAEQEAIAEWLDEKCQAIDAAIAKVDREIELIDELKQSEISRVVTRGLNPDAPLRPSGIEWIGDVPEHWEIAPIKYSFRIISGATPKTEKPEYWDGDISWITPADYKSDDHYVKHGRKNITKEGLLSCATEIVPKHSLIFSKRAPIGTVALAAGALCTNQGCISCVPNAQTNSNYFYYLCRIVTCEFEILGSGATFLEISSTNFANFPMPLPPLPEQQAIADYLDKKCAEIDGLKEKLVKKRETLKELRQAIISEVVTGKRKVI